MDDPSTLQLRARRTIHTTPGGVWLGGGGSGTTPARARLSAAALAGAAIETTPRPHRFQHGERREFSTNSPSPFLEEILNFHKRAALARWDDAKQLFRVSTKAELEDLFPAELLFSDEQHEHLEVADEEHKDSEGSAYDLLRLSVDNIVRFAGPSSVEEKPPPTFGLFHALAVSLSRFPSEKEKRVHLKSFFLSLIDSAAYVFDEENYNAQHDLVELGGIKTSRTSRLLPLDQKARLFASPQSLRLSRGSSKCLPQGFKVSRSFVRGILANALLANIKMDPMEDLKEDPINFGGLDFGRDFLRAPAPCEKLKCLVDYFERTMAEEVSHTTRAAAIHPPEQAVHFEVLTLDPRELAFRLSPFRTMQKDSAPRTDAPRRTNAAAPSTDGGVVPPPAPPRDFCSDSRTHKSPNHPMVLIHAAPMETPTAHAIVNFANKNFGFGRLTPFGATQEEILQICRPEFNLGLLHFGAVSDESVVLVHNVRQFAEYSGYGARGFRFLQKGKGRGSFPPPGPAQTIVTVDAVRDDWFAPSSVWRDVGKFYLGLVGVVGRELGLERDWWRSWGLVGRQVREEEDGKSRPSFADHGADAPQIVVSSGLWGCGAFGGNAYHKFVQQYAAVLLVEERLSEVMGSSSGSRIQLLFSTFGNEKLRENLKTVERALVDAGLSGQELFHGVLVREEVPLRSLGAEGAETQKIFGAAAEGDLSGLLGAIREAGSSGEGER